MKRKVGVFFLGISVIALIYLTCFAGRSLSYAQHVIDEQEFNRIISDREESHSLLEGIRFNEEDLFFDRSSGTFYYSLIEESSAAFNPSVRVASAYDDVQIAFLDGEITTETIENNQTVTVLVYSREFYCRYGLICTTLPLMNINCPEDIGDDYVDMDIALFDNQKGAVNRVVNSSGSIRIRGGDSRRYPKKGYRIQLTMESLGLNERPNHVSLLGMRQDDDWLLYAGYNDQEKVRNVFSSNLWMYSCAADNEDHIDAGMEYKYLELFINGEYWGLYALGYPIDKKQLGFGKDVSKEALYKTSAWFNEKNVGLTEDGAVPGYSQKGVAQETTEGWRLLAEYYQNLQENSAYSEALYDGIDIDNAIDTYLFVNLIQGVDHAGKNQINEIYNLYLAISENQDGGLKGLFIPWDMDRTWGNSFGDIPYGIKPDLQVSMEAGYLNQIISNQDTDIWEKIFSKYQALRSGVWSNGTINAQIDQYEADIFDSGAYVRDMERWPDGIYADPSDKLDVFRRYVNERLTEADSYYERMEDFCQESLFVRRSASYNDFDQCRFLIEINDKSLLSDSEYVDLLEYLKIDISEITDDIHYIAAVPSQNSVEYFETLGNVGDTLSTNAGVISLKEAEEGYEIKLDGVTCYRVSPTSERQGMSVVFVSDSGSVNKLSLWKP